jgi:hypothetical protein
LACVIPEAVATTSQRSSFVSFIIPIPVSSKRVVQNRPDARPPKS